MNYAGGNAARETLRSNKSAKVFVSVVKGVGGFLC